VKRPHACANRTHAAAAGAGSSRRRTVYPGRPSHSTPPLLRRLPADRKRHRARTDAPGRVGRAQAGNDTQTSPGGKRQVLIVTSESAHPYLARVARELPVYFPDLKVRAVAAKNEFFGGGVTVAGLLAARDVVRCARTAGCRGCTVILRRSCSIAPATPSTVFRPGESEERSVCRWTVAASLNDMVQSL